MTDAVIFDMDGTLADVSSIRHHVRERPKNFDAFHSESITCPPNHWVQMAAIDAHRDGFAVLIVTARREQWSMHTLLWLRDNHIHHDALFMRDNHDVRKDFLVKQDILAQIRALGLNPVLAFDDNPNVIDLWQSNGIDTIVVPGWEN